MLRQRGLDLAELDPVAAELDLEVEPAEELERTVGSKAAEISRLVERGAGEEGRGDEALGGELGAIEVAERDAVAPMWSSPGTPTGTGWSAPSST